MRFLRRSLIGVLMMALTAGALAWAGGSVWQAVSRMMAEDTPSRPGREVVLAVNAVPVASGPAVPILETFGEIRSRRSLLVRASVEGVLVELSPKFQNGGQVEAGELLARLDPAGADADLALARADLTEAEATLQDAITGISLAEDDLEVAREQVRLREQALGRQQDLLSRGVGSASAMETAALAVAAARQTVVSRRQALAQAQAREDQASTGLDRRRVAVAEAERLLAETEIRARFKGTLSDVSVVEGGLVTRNEQLARLVDPELLDVAFRLSTAQYARLIDDQGVLRDAQVEVVMDVAGLDLTAAGRIVRESPVVAEGQTGRLVFAQLDPAPGFRAGDIVTVRIREQELKRVATLPARSVDASGMVLVIGDDDRLSEAPVEVLRAQGDHVLVRAPDLEGAEIVSERTPVLGAGIKVRPLRPQPEGAAPAPRSEEESLVSLTAERRAELISFVEGNSRMSEEARNRVLALLAQDQVPARVVERIERRMGS